MLAAPGWSSGATSKRPGHKACSSASSPELEGVAAQTPRRAGRFSALLSPTVCPEQAPLSARTSPTPSPSADGAPFPWEQNSVPQSAGRDWRDLPCELLAEIFAAMKDSKGAMPSRKVMLSACGVCRSWRAAGRQLFYPAPWREQSNAIVHPEQLLALSPAAPDGGLLRCFVKRVDKLPLPSSASPSPPPAEGALCCPYRVFRMYHGADHKGRHAQFMMSACQTARRRYVLSMNPKPWRGGKGDGVIDGVAVLHSDITATNYQLHIARSPWVRRMMADAGFVTGPTASSAPALLRLGYRLRVRGIMLPRRMRVTLPSPQAPTSNPLFESNPLFGAGPGAAVPHAPLAPHRGNAMAAGGESGEARLPPIRLAGSDAQARAADGSGPPAGQVPPHGVAEAASLIAPGSAAPPPSSLAHLPLRPTTANGATPEHGAAAAAAAAGNSTSTNLSSGSAASQQRGAWLRRAVHKMKALRKGGGAASKAHGSRAPPPEVELQNKPPHWNEALRCWCLNFRGRVKMASVKNFQLVASNDSTSRCVMQFGKVEEDVYVLDYNPAVMNAAQAFAAALSSFETKYLV